MEALYLHLRCQHRKSVLPSPQVQPRRRPRGRDLCPPLCRLRLGLCVQRHRHAGPQPSRPRRRHAGGRPAVPYSDPRLLAAPRLEPPFQGAERQRLGAGEDAGVLPPVCHARAAPHARPEHHGASHWHPRRPLAVLLQLYLPPGRRQQPPRHPAVADQRCREVGDRDCEPGRGDRSYGGRRPSVSGPRSSPRGLKLAEQTRHREREDGMSGALPVKMLQLVRLGSQARASQLLRCNLSR
mmetsp:Transcript_11402/g.27052  ORF Transcript_11402/g.27052 Transcript_11402/m.27052 type:complete len:239 (-) Transcript_11402:412-1128(-)